MGKIQPEFTHNDWLEFDRYQAREKLSDFIRLAWHVIEPSMVYRHSWHIDAVCEHLEAVTSGEITRLLINIPPGTMKALDGDTPIWTINGWKRHGDLEVGDYVFGSDGEPKRVIAVTPEVLEPSYRIGFDTGESIIAGAAHEWVVEREFQDKASNWKRDRREITVDTRDLFSKDTVKGHQRQDRISVCKPVYGVRRDLLIDPYILGAWLSDGGKDGGSIYVCGNDRLHMEDKTGVSATLTRPATDRGDDFYRITVPGLSTRLRVLGLLDNKHIPEEYLKGSIQQRESLLQGLMDTDGHCPKDGQCVFSNKNRRIIDGVIDLALSLGFKVTSREKPSILNGKYYGPYWQVYFRPNHGIEPFTLPRKHERMREPSQKRYLSRFVNELCHVGDRLVKCIQVEGGIYLAGRELIPTHNSLLMNVFWPAWEWGPKGMSGMRYIGASHEQSLSIRDNRKMRQLVASPWYQERWPTELAHDQNMKTKFENKDTGFRQACAVASMTGNRGDRVLWDDPNKVEDGFSVVELQKTIRIFTETLPTRVNDPANSAIIICMQRIHEEDISGYIIEQELPYEHLMLPMEFEPERKCYTSIGFEDPRTEDGELLFPDRFPLEVIERDKQVMGPLSTAGQFQQRPAPRSGGMFAWENFEIVGSAPAELKYQVRYWDKAGTDGGGAYTAGVRMGYCERTKQWYVMDVVRGQWEASKRERVIRQTAESDGRKVKIWIEQEPGSGGKESAEATIRNLGGFTCKAERATGDKAIRAEPYSVQVEAHNIKVVQGNWNKAFIDEHKTFPAGKYKDQIDAASGAFNRLAENIHKRAQVAFI